MQLQRQAHHRQRVVRPPEGHLQAACTTSRWARIGPWAPIPATSTERKTARRWKAIWTTRCCQGCLAQDRPHTFYLGRQRVSGDSKWLRVNGTSGGTLANDSYNSSYDNAREHSWQLRYDYNFAALGVPGLIFMTRYIKGHNVHVGALDDGEEWGRESELASVVQSGPAKNPTLRWRNSTMRRDWGNNNQFNEQRLIVQYPLSLL